MSTRLLLEEALRRNIPVDIISAKKNMYAVEIHGKTRIWKSTAFDNSTSMVRICDDKALTQKLLKRWGYRTPEQYTFLEGEDEEAWETAQRLKKYVVKPMDAAHGYGVTVLPGDKTEFGLALRLARKFRNQAKEIAIEEFVGGEDYRFLFVNNTLIYAIHRKPAAVVGDGVHTIRELIEEENARDVRGDIPYEHFYAPIKIDRLLRRVLEMRQLTLKSIPKKGEEIRLRLVCNSGRGGTDVDVTEQIQPVLLEQVATLVRKLGMTIVAIDVRSPEIGTVTEMDAMTILELNATPAITMADAQWPGAKVWDALLKEE